MSDVWTVHIYPLYYSVSKTTILAPVKSASSYFGHLLQQITSCWQDNLPSARTLDTNDFSPLPWLRRYFMSHPSSPTRFLEHHKSAMSSPTPINDAGSALTAKILDSGKYSDLTIESQGLVFKVHRNIVCLQSKPLAAHVDGQFKVSVSSVCLLGLAPIGKNISHCFGIILLELAVLLIWLQ
jgi:hypothetical protein